MDKVFYAGIELIVRPEPFALRLTRIVDEFALTEAETRRLVAEYEADTAEVAAIDWEHGDDFVAQEYRALVRGSRIE